MHSEDVVCRALTLRRLGFTQVAIGRRLGISRDTIQDWVSGQLPDFDLRTSGKCEKRCGEFFEGPRNDYVYLLGLYLGDGSIATHPRSVYRLRIACDDKYPKLKDRCESAMRAVMPNNCVQRIGCSEITMFSKHWPCLFPQHGPGKKHDREITLEPWQQELVDIDPRPLIEGLIHSDGWRGTNFAINAKTKKRYEYPRYQFSNVSTDIHQIFTDALDQLQIPWKQMNRVNVSIARRDAVAMMDSFIAPKC